MTADWAIECQLNSTVRAGRRGTGPIPLPPEHMTQVKVKGLPLLGSEGSGRINLSAEMPALCQWASLLP